MALENQFSMNINMTRFDKSELLNVDNPQYHQLQAKYPHLDSVTMNDMDKKPKLPVHLILEASDYLCIKTDHPLRVGKTGEPVAKKTKFGWTSIAKGTEIDYTALLLTQSNQTD